MAGRKRKGSNVDTSMIHGSPDVHSLNLTFPERTYSSPLSLSSETSTYFSGEMANSRERAGSNGRHRSPMEGSLAETPGPGYTSFAQHLMDVDAASTPVDQGYEEKQLTPITVPTAAATRKLNFQNSAAITPPISQRQGNKKDRPLPELRFLPGESGLLAQSVLQQVTPTTKVRQPVVHAPKRRAPPRPVILYPTTEEIIVQPPQGSSAGSKLVKLRDNYENGEFVDLLLHEDTLSWDIVRDPQLGRLRIVFHQKIE